MPSCSRSSSCQPSQERPSQAITRSRKVTTSWEKMRKSVSPFSAVARRGSPMWPGSLRSLVIQPCEAGSNGIAGETGSIALRSPTRSGRQMQDHRGLPLAGVAHLVLHDRGIDLVGLAPQEPVGRRQEEQVVALAVALAGLEDRLLRRHDVAAVAVQEHDPAEAVTDQVVDQVAQQVEISPRRGRERAGEIEVMVRVAQPQERRPDHAVAERLGRAADDFAQQHAVGEDRQMPAMLLDGRDRHDDRQVASRPRPPPASSFPLASTGLPHIDRDTSSHQPSSTIGSSTVQPGSIVSGNGS